MDQFQNQISVNPIGHRRSERIDNVRFVTSGNAGKVVPLTYIPLLREDGVSSGRFQVSVEMMETAELLMNAVHVEVQAHFVPFLAFDRFTGMDSLNRSYMGEPERPEDEVVPFIETALAGPHGDNEIYKAMGLHGRPDSPLNTSVVEAYNMIVNHRRKMRSKSITLRDRLDTDLAEAFWQHTVMRHIVPDFDQARIDGEVPLNVVGSQLPVRGLTINGVATGGVFQVDGAAASGTSTDYTRVTARLNTNNSALDGIQPIFAELSDNGITVSLSNIDMAKKTAAFARLREQYQGHDDDYIVDLLMAGVRIPEQAMRQPMLMGRQSTILGYSRRYATDGDNLDKSVTQGMTTLAMNLRLPPVNTGGVVLVTIEVTPEQIWERTKDHFLYSSSVASWPNALRDELDPEQVDVVTNDHVDIDHSDPDGTFGYAPMNHVWQRDFTRVGGKFYRPVVDAAFDEDRQRIWANETVDPTLSDDFYLCTNLHQKVFADNLADGFEFMGRHQAVINGLTVFGAKLSEATDDYEQVLSVVPQQRIVKSPAP